MHKNPAFPICPYLARFNSPAEPRIRSHGCEIRAGNRHWVICLIPLNYAVDRVPWQSAGQVVVRREHVLGVHGATVPPGLEQTEACVPKWLRIAADIVRSATGRMRAPTVQGGTHVHAAISVSARRRFAIGSAM